MRQVICLQCGKSFDEDDGNPAIHYSSYSRFNRFCLHCKAYNDWLKGNINRRELNDVEK